MDITKNNSGSFTDKTGKPCDVRFIWRRFFATAFQSVKGSQVVIKNQDTLWWTNILPWTITIFNGKIHYKWPFSIAMLVHQRVWTIVNSRFFSSPCILNWMSTESMISLFFLVNVQTAWFILQILDLIVIHPFGQQHVTRSLTGGASSWNEGISLPWLF